MYQYTAPSTVLLALHQRFQVAGSIRVKGPRMGTRFPHSYIRTVSMRTVSSESVRNNKGNTTTAMMKLQQCDDEGNTMTATTKRQQCNSEGTTTTQL